MTDMNREMYDALRSANADETLAREAAESVTSPKGMATKYDILELKSYIQKGFGDIRKEMQDGFTDIRGEMQDGLAKADEKNNALKSTVSYTAGAVSVIAVIVVGIALMLLKGS